MLRKDYSYKKLARSLLTRLLKLHKENFASDKSFEIKTKIVLTCPFEFPFENYRANSPETRWEFNVHFRDAINEYWAKLEEERDDDALYELGKWMVKTVGDISGNEEKNLERYVRKARSHYTVVDKDDRVSSYSKILAAKDRYKYQILDTRVAASLNILQLNYFGSRRYYIPVVDPRSNSLKDFNKVFPRSRFLANGCKPIPKTLNIAEYTFYTEIVNEMARIAKEDALFIECLLFAYAPILTQDFDELQEKFDEDTMRAKARDEYWRSRGVYRGIGG